MNRMLRGALLLAAVVVGVLISGVGTLIHGNIWALGEAGSAAVVPWGALLALILMLLALIWIGMAYGSLLGTLVMGATVFTLVSFAYSNNSAQLMVPYSAAAWEYVPGAVLASAVWWLGSGLITLLGMVLVKWLLLKDAADHSGSDQRHVVESSARHSQR